MDCQAPTPAAEVGVRVSFEDCGGDGILLETLGEHEAGDASADDEDVRLRLLWGGNSCCCHFGRSGLVLSDILSSFPSFILFCITSRLKNSTRITLETEIANFVAGL